MLTIGWSNGNTFLARQPQPTFDGKIYLLRRHDRTRSGVFHPLHAVGRGTTAKHRPQRSIGDLFYLMVPELSDLPYYEALCRIMRQFADFIQQHALLDEQAVQDMLDIFMEQLPKIWTQNLCQCA